MRTIHSTKFAGLLLLLFVFFAKADPANFMVGEFTFIRPPEWTWITLPGQSTVSAHLKTFTKKPGEESQILISFGDKKKEEIIEKYKSYFVSTTDLTSRSEEKHSGKYSLAYLTIEGTHRVNHQLKPNHVLIAITVETGKGLLYGRIIGPKEMMKNAGAEFKKMIEDGLRENQ